MVLQKQINLELIDQFIIAAKGTTATVERIPANAESLNNSLAIEVGNELVLLSEPG